MLCLKIVNMTRVKFKAKFGIQCIEIRRCILHVLNFMRGNFFMIFCCCLLFICICKEYLLKKILQKDHQIERYKQFGSRSGPTFESKLFGVCKSYQQTSMFVLKGPSR